ncbi:uncharacterized protein LOC132744809 [Ruditapes philippinarum]|uniref:uncharacterized protein LOC132744809 n=1 Tax=Ruditapes philippinarum TaxID=129788 RepID=UPI00295BA28E|nr:uncharacterized protein LOC132744809 [Ruditapes philippinarum]
METRGLGGNDAERESAHAHPPEDKIDNVVNKLDTQLSRFSEATKNIKTLATAVAEMRQDINELKRRPSSIEKGPTPAKKRIISLGEDYERSNNSDPSPATATICTATIPVATDSDSDGDDDVDRVDGEMNDPLMDYFNGNQNENANEDDEFDQLEQFFQTVEETDGPVESQLAKIAGLALRGRSNKLSTQDEEAIETYKKKYKRPENIDSLQVPKLDDVIWRDAKSGIKSYDFMLQKTTSALNLALIPTIRALENIKKNGDVHRTQEFVMDTFKILCLLVRETTATRAARIKKWVPPQYKSVCDLPASSKNLFGDNLEESIKKLDGPKIKMTASRIPFLGKRGGRNYSNNNRSSNYSPGYSNNTNYQQQRRVYKQNQPQQHQRPKQHQRGGKRNNQQQKH